MMGKMMKINKKISVIIPCFNEEKGIVDFYEELSCVMAANTDQYEILFIDDGSTDLTLDTLLEVYRKDEHVRVLELSRNFGHQAAISAGLDAAEGDAVIMMDADMQHPVAVIPAMLEKWLEGYDVVYTIRNDPPDIRPFKKITAKLFYKSINFLGNINLPENSADFRLLDAMVVEQFKRITEKTKFLRGLVSWVGFRQYALQYDAAARHAGESKYTLKKMFKFAFDGITSFSAFPLHISTFIGVFVSLLSFIYAGYAVFIKIFTDEALTGWASLLASVLFLGGVQLLSLGIIGEYLHRIYIETKGRPIYITRKEHSREQPPF